MLVSFAIDPDAITEPAGDLHNQIAIHERCIDTWLRLGVLVHNGLRLEESDFWEEVQKLGVNLRKRWQTARKIGFSRDSGSTGSLRDIHGEKELEALVGAVDVVCLEQTRAMLAGLEEEQFSKLLGSKRLEVIRFLSSDRSQLFSEAKDIAMEPVPEGVRVLDLWQTRFLNLAKVARNVSIIDRYAGDNEATLNFDGTKRFDGLSWLLKQLDGAGRKIKVTLFTGFGQRTRAEVQTSIEAISFARGGVAELQVYLLPERRFGHHAHCRSIRFDHLICEIGTGCEIFDGNHVRRPSSFTMKLLTDHHRNIEKQLKQDREMSHFARRIGSP